MIELASSSAHVFVERLEQPVLDDLDRHHLERVLRLRNGESVSVSDGRGSWRWCRWADGALSVESEIAYVRPPTSPTTVAFALVKGDRLDWMVQKLTEIGIDRLLPIVADHAVVRWGADRAATNTERLRRIAREAAMQARRVRLPEVGDLAASTELLARSDVWRADLGGESLPVRLRSSWTAPTALPPVVAVGPEGGWSARERALPNPVVGLGETVLRTETAALVAGIALMNARSDHAGTGNLDSVSE